MASTDQINGTKQLKALKESIERLYEKKFVKKLELISVYSKVRDTCVNEKEKELLPLVRDGKVSATQANLYSWISKPDAAVRPLRLRRLLAQTPNESLQAWMSSQNSTPSSLETPTNDLQTNAYHRIMHRIQHRTAASGTSNSSSSNGKRHEGEEKKGAKRSRDSEEKKSGEATPRPTKIKQKKVTTPNESSSSSSSSTMGTSTATSLPSSSSLPQPPVAVSTASTFSRHAGASTFGRAPAPLQLPQHNVPSVPAPSPSMPSFRNQNISFQDVLRLLPPGARLLNRQIDFTFPDVSSCQHAEQVLRPFADASGHFVCETHGSVLRLHLLNFDEQNWLAFFTIVLGKPTM